MTKFFTVSNCASSVTLGTFQADTPEAAMAASRVAAGYATEEAAAEVLGVTVDQLNDDLVAVELEA